MDQHRWVDQFEQKANQINLMFHDSHVPKFPDWINEIITDKGGTIEFAYCVSNSFVDPIITKKGDTIELAFCDNESTD